MSSPTVAERRNGHWGFTLVELLGVMFCAAILAMIAVPNFLEAQVRAKVAVVHGEASTIRIALANYRADHHTYPPNLYFDLLGYPSELVHYERIDREEFLSRPPIASLCPKETRTTDSPCWDLSSVLLEDSLRYYWPERVAVPLPPADEENRQMTEEERNYEALLRNEEVRAGMQDILWEEMMNRNFNPVKPVTSPRSAPTNLFNAEFSRILEINSQLGLAPLVNSSRDSGYLTARLPRDPFTPEDRLTYVCLEPIISDNAAVQNDDYTTTTVINELPPPLDKYRPRQPYLIFSVGPDQRFLEVGDDRLGLYYASPFQQKIENRLQSYDPTNGTISDGDLIYGEHGRVLDLY